VKEEAELIVGTARSTAARGKQYASVPAAVEAVAKEVVDAAYKVHKTLGPGLLESVYEACLRHELKKRGLGVEAQVPVPVVYEGLHLDAGLRLDLLVDGRLIVEVKSVERMNPVYDAQLPTYLKLTGHRLGLLINFNVSVIKQGISRVVC
jgi:GxxExxY protein